MKNNKDNNKYFRTIGILHQLGNIKNAPDSICNKSILEYKDQVLALDASMFLKRFVHGYRKIFDSNSIYFATTEQDYQPITVHPHPHILGFYNLTIFLKQHNIKPIFVFDGKFRIKEKRREIMRRREVYNKAIDNLKFEKIRVNRLAKWKDVHEKMKNLNDVNSEYINTGILDEMFNGYESADIQSSLSAPTIEEISKPTKKSVELESDQIVLQTETIKSDEIKPVELKSDQEIHASPLQDDIPIPPLPTSQSDLAKPSPIKTTAELLSSPSPASLIESPLLETPPSSLELSPPTLEAPSPYLDPIITPTINTNILEMMSKIDNEKTFKERHPDFVPSSGEILLKENVEEIVKSTLLDSALLTNDERLYSRPQQIIGQMEQKLLDNEVENVHAESHNMAVTLENRAMYVSWEMYEDCIEFLETWGFPCIVTNDCEAESLCASLAASGYANATVSEDMDTTLYGDGILLRNLFSKSKPIIEISPKKARESLGLSQSQFIDLCILCGTDFSNTIPGIGPVRAFDLIKAYGSIENILKNLIESQGALEQAQAARHVFQKPPIITDKYLNKLKLLDNYENAFNNMENNENFNQLLVKYQVYLAEESTIGYNTLYTDYFNQFGGDGTYNNDGYKEFSLEKDSITIPTVSQLGPDPFYTLNPLIIPVLTMTNMMMEISLANPEATSSEIMGNLKKLNII
ncbi:1187_t:CDS:2 [Entrophospora sp. SA101]|nr:12160_t:CDS:2 [Entrophospora sp. SA101]CAJ0645309.1 1187_t:CDS:2 [Entrophospora sp. SA101]CAJ0838395.1 2008_t:CDS:2 [Entrophospora sp. SA101]CAJ0844132.1 5693_t:CDS:2 [Entrophospora sp. SA101]CAJ0911243.1 7678_t:CDS:2 [Entrophospora sp. SA101]